MYQKVIYWDYGFYISYLNYWLKDYLTQIAIIISTLSLFDLNLNYDDEKLDNTCNKNKYNIANLYVPQPKKEVDICYKKTN